jgi:protein-S-isoprenylcysteine O-methyltransferase Ste14
MAFITRRFIHGEEARIAARFGDTFHAYCLRTRRWI